MRIVPLLAGLCLSACLPTPPVEAPASWFRLDASRGEFASDRTHCAREAERYFTFHGAYGETLEPGVEGDEERFAACMNGRGWERERRRFPLFRALRGR